MVRKKQGKKNKTKRPKFSSLESVLYNAGVLGYSLLLTAPAVPYTGIDTITLEGLTTHIAEGWFPAIITLGILNILITAFRVFAGVVWEAISQGVVSLVGTLFRMDKSPQVLERRIQLWLFTQFAFSPTQRMALGEDIVTFSRLNSWQARWGLFFLILSALGSVATAATVLNIAHSSLIPDTIVIDLKVYLVTAVLSLEMLRADKSFRYGPALKREFPFEAMSIKTDKVRALVDRVVLSPVKIVAMKFTETLSLIAKLRGILRTFFNIDGFTAKWGYALLGICISLMLAITIFDLAPESASTNLKALSASIIGSLVMIGMGNGKSYRTR